MTILIHGDDLVASRKKLNEEKERFKESEIVHLEGSKLQLSDLVLASEASSLFLRQKLIIVENLLSSGAVKQKPAVIEYLSKDTSLHTIVLWENKKIEKTVIKKYLAHAKVISCELPPLLFKFLDSLGLSTPSAVLTTFHNLIAHTEVELVFAMILRQWRLLLMVKDQEAAVEGLASWQAGKLKYQGRAFTMDTLINSYRQLLAIDYKIKTGQTPYSLRQLLDFFLLNI